jgi:hypothetical protein
MAVVTEWGRGIVKLLEFMGGLYSYTTIPGYKVTDETPERIKYDTTYTHTRTGNLVELNAAPQLSTPDTYNVVEAGIGWYSHTLNYLVRVTGTEDAVTNSNTVVNLSLTFTR